MLATSVILAVICALLVLMLRHEEKKNTSLSEQNSTLKGRLETIEDTMRTEEPQKNLLTISSEEVQKPLSIDSIRTALRYNGLSPETIEGQHPRAVYFRYNDVLYEINTGNLHLIAIAAIYNVGDAKVNSDLLSSAAEVLTSEMFVCKVYMSEEGKSITYSVEFICDSYLYLRNNIKEYIGLLEEAQRRLYDRYEDMKCRQETEREAVFSGRSYIRDSQHDKIPS